MLERGSGWPQQGFCTCEPNPLHGFGPGPVFLRCSRQKCSERVDASRCLAARFPGVCNANCNHLISVETITGTGQSTSAQHMQLWHIFGIWYSLVWRAFLHWDFSPVCQQAAGAQNRKAMQITQVLVMSALSANLQKALANYFSFPQGHCSWKILKFSNWVKVFIYRKKAGC